MIKFFRNIRRAMVKENRVSKYFLYALGEIILVVIGILIALQINNWNESRIAQKDLENVQNNLTQEFELNRKDLQNVINMVEYTRKGSVEILNLIGKEDLSRSEEEVNALFERSLFFPTWKPSNFTLKELQNTGRLELIKNDSLKQLLFLWEKQIEIIEEWNRRIEKSSQDLIDYLKENGSIRNINHERISVESSTLDVRNLPLLYDVKFENQIDEKALYSQFMLTYLDDANNIISKIMEQVTKE